MALYRCSRCDQIKDNDVDVGMVDPDDDTELVCPRCYSFFDEEEPQDLEL